MDPMGFYESVLFTVMVSVVYGICGYAFLIFIPRFDGEQNMVVKCGAVIVWPVLAALVLARGMSRLSHRFYVDAGKLLPRQPGVRIPKQVTVEMLAAERGNEYVPGQWANNADVAEGNM